MKRKNEQAKQLWKVKRYMEKENAKRPAFLSQLPREQWPNDGGGTMLEVWLSNKYLVQLYDEGNGVKRMSVNRTVLNREGQWRDNLTWDELQEIKRQIGQGDSFAVEVYPGDKDIVNIANMRHLWITPEPILGWINSPLPEMAMEPVSL